MSKIICGHCAKKAIFRNPQVFGDSSVEWISLLEAGIPRVCPSCGPIYLLAKIVANSPMFSQETKNIAATVCGALLILAGVVYIDNLISQYT